MISTWCLVCERENAITSRVRRSVFLLLLLLHVHLLLCNTPPPHPPRWTHTHTRTSSHASRTHLGHTVVHDQLILSSRNPRKTLYMHLFVIASVRLVRARAVTFLLQLQFHAAVLRQALAVNGGLSFVVVSRGAVTLRCSTGSHDSQIALFVPSRRLA